MSANKNEVAVVQPKPRALSVSDYAHDVKFKARIEETLGKRTPQFISSVITLANSNKALGSCDPVKLFNCCLMAAALNLPFNQNLGQAFIIAYKGEPQLQIGWKGFIQLAQRSGQFRTINCTDVREGEIVSRDRMTGEFEFKWIQDEAERKKAKVVGYLAFFKLLNGFEKNLYMTVEELNAHGAKYSKSYSRSDALWKTDFEAMASKTVLKLLLNRYAPLETDSDLAKAIKADQADSDGDYIDNPKNIVVEGAEFGSSEEQDNAGDIIEAETVD